MSKYPLIHDETNSYIPDISKCPICGADFVETGFVFFTGGVLPMKSKGNMIIKHNLNFRMFLDVGFHGNEFTNEKLIPLGLPETYTFFSIIDKYGKDNEFEFNFCSVECLRKWFNRICDDLINEILIEQG
jgi:hypothetical protein